MKYFKSYLYTNTGADSIKYKIHTGVKYTVIVAYTAVIVYFERQNKKGIAWEKYKEI
jgi:hypothetical protein